jgi:hypothetical protein
MYFMVLAMSYGLRVSSPYGGFGPYDVGVENGSGPILRVQVKCTLYQCKGGCYCMSINMKDGFKGRKGYAPGTVDFFAIYIIPTDDWYILPYAAIGDRDANVYFRPGVKGQKYGAYREAWQLLLEAAKGPERPPLEIRACWDEGDAAQGMREVALTAAARKMFRGVFQG